MKVLSLNVNNFGGLKCKKDCTSRQWKELDETKTFVATEIFTYIQTEKPIIAVLHEFELNTDIADVFIKCMKKIDYNIVPYEETTLKNPSMTIMFVREELLYEKLNNPHKFKTNKTLRASVIKTADCIIYGVHIPTGDCVFWEELRDFYLKNKDKKLVVIGDLNVYNISAKYKEEYLKLLDMNAKDVWLERGYSNATKTYKKGGRLDYAIMSPKLYECLNSIRIDPYLMDNNQTDHASIIIDF